MKKALTLLVLLVSLCLQAQSHNYKNCKLVAKNLVTEANICPACLSKIQKEKKARIAETKRINDVKAAKTKAKLEAERKAFEEERRRRLEEEARRKAQEEAAEKRRQELLAKYRELSKNSNVALGGQKLDVNGVAYTPDIKEFYDNTRRKFGFKLSDEPVLELDYPADANYLNIYRVDQTDFFIVNVYGKTDEGNYSYIVDGLGQSIKVDGDFRLYDNVFVDKNNKSISVYRLKSSLKKHGEELVNGAETSRLFRFVNSEGDVGHHYQKYLNTDFRGLGFGYFVKYAPAVGYVLDYNMNVVEKKQGVAIQHGK